MPERLGFELERRTAVVERTELESERRTSVMERSGLNLERRVSIPERSSSQQMPHSLKWLAENYQHEYNNSSL